MKWSLLFFTIFLYSHHSGGTSYYLSEKGNDNNNGTSKTTPWLSLGKLKQNNKLIIHGDSILLERGSLFRGNIEIITSDIFIGAYGTGSKPIITGAIPLGQWKLVKKNIWTTHCGECNEAPGNILMNGKSQPLGRYPDEGYLTISGLSSSQTSLTDSTLNFTSDYWNNAEVVVKSSRWTLDNLPVERYSKKTFMFKKPASYVLQNGFGYFIQKHPATLTQHGEWYFDSNTKLIYLYVSAGKKPDQYLIEADIHEIGLTAIQVNNLHIESLVFQHYRVSGVRLENDANIELHGVDIFNSGKNGLEITGCDHLIITNNCISDSNNNGVQWHNNSNGIFSQNSICKTGLQPGQGESGNGTHIALHITADRPQPGTNLFQYNTIDSTGYSAIDFRTGNTQILNNLISNFCLTKDDGAGIYTWNNTQKGNRLEDNMIFNGVGSGAGTTFPLQLFANGIYIDDRSRDVFIKGNRIFNCATSGIFLHNAQSITLINNIVYGNGYNISNPEKGQLYIRLDTLGLFGTNRSLELKVTNNHWIAENDATHCIYISVEKENDMNQLGIFNENKYQANFNYQAVAALNRAAGSCLAAEDFSLIQWHRTMNYEKGSTYNSTLKENHSNEIENRNLIANGNMTEDIKGWMVWPDKSSIQQESIKILEGPSLKINVPGGSTEALIYHEGISLTKGKLYRLSFSAISANPNNVEFVPLMAKSPWDALGGYTCFSIGATKKTFTHFFIPTISCSNARVNFKSLSGFWIDNVSLNEVE